jgi:predicted XRE-type DNA-binding protein
VATRSGELVKSALVVEEASTAFGGTQGRVVDLAKAKLRRLSQRECLLGLPVDHAIDA